ncbi:unnamed protein product [Meganyctiphanes norvegica]|uniref:Mpv17-like protein n=1 Tax=Meganyctiphanes norvegica TaxID=48144 RepID=A0AAV2QW45_MEGNR
MLHRAAGALKGLIAKRPIIGNGIIFGGLYTSAEFMGQTFNNKISRPVGEKLPYDTDTLARYTFMGSCVLPHSLWAFYKVLDAKFIGNAWPMVISKLTIDALLVTPVNLTIFYVGMSALEGKEDLLAEWRQKIFKTFVTASVFWVPASLINFKFLPPQARVIYVGICQLIWVSILCAIKRE